MINGNEKIEGEGAAQNEGAPAIEAAAPAAPAKAAKGKGKGKGKGKLAEGKAAKQAKADAQKAAAPAARKGLAARMAKQDAGKAAHAAALKQAEKAKADRPLSAGSDIARDAEMHFSGLPHNMPSPSDIEKAEGLCKRMIGRDLARYKEALKGNLPIGEFDGAPIDLSLKTHEGYKGKWKALKALIDAGDLAALEGWNNGLGIRQNSSSSKPLGRFHQCAILALRAKAAAKAKRQAGKAAKAEAGEAQAPA
jgi:hypothetical protein